MKQLNMMGKRSKPGVGNGLPERSASTSWALGCLPPLSTGLTCQCSGTSTIKSGRAIARLPGYVVKLEGCRPRHITNAQTCGSCALEHALQSPVPPQLEAIAVWY